jgi:hypothetical protein
LKTFVAKHAEKITGVLSGFDRMLFRGTLRELSYAAGMTQFLSIARVLRKNFGAFCDTVTMQLREASLAAAEKLGRPILYLPGGNVDKEALARKVEREDRIDRGLICVLKAVEPCKSFRVVHVKGENRFELRLVPRKCLHLYHYMKDPLFGFMHARLQTWFPFNLQICLNGREWLAQAMDRAGIAYERHDNCFLSLDDVPSVQKLADRQVRTRWETHLNRIARQVNPALPRILGRFRSAYYWSLLQSEWATDILFEDPKHLAAIYRPLVRHGITGLSSGDVMRFLGGKVHGCFGGQIVSDFKNRPEGIRIKHRVNHNSVKLYDKQGTILRVETTVNQPSGFKVFRHKQGDPHGEKAWRQMRQGIADLPRRAEVSKKSNERYLEALAAADTSTPLAQLLEPVLEPVRWKKTRVRGLRPWSREDLRLLQAVTRGEFCINGFRNKDLRPLLLDQRPSDPVEARRFSRRVTRLIRLLRAHHLVRKIPRTHRYKATRKAHEIAFLLLATRELTSEQINRLAA